MRALADEVRAPGRAPSRRRRRARAGSRRATRRAGTRRAASASSRAASSSSTSTPSARPAGVGRAAARARRRRRAAAARRRAPPRAGASSACARRADLVARRDGVGEQVGRRGVRARVDDGDTIGNEVHRKCPGSPAQRKDTGARFPARRARRVAADPLDLVRRRRSGRPRTCGARWVCDRIEEARRRPRPVVPTAGNPLAVGELRSFRDGRADRPDLRALRRAERRRPGSEWHSHAVRARGARRPAVRARRLGRQGQLPAAAARRLPPGARRRAARARARARRGRGGGRRPPRARLARGGRARRRLRDRLRLGHGGRGHARADDRRARDRRSSRSTSAPRRATCTRACTAAPR